MTTCGSKTLLALVTAFVAFGGLAKPAYAQLGWTFAGVGEYDTDHVYLVVGGISVSPRSGAWSPVSGVTAYWLQYPIGTTMTGAKKNVTVVEPSIGLKNGFGTGSFEMRVGYAFTNATNNSAIPAFTASTGDGVVNSAQVDYWGSGAYSLQGIADYNYGAQSFFGRGRIGKRLFAAGNNSNVSLGAEAAYIHSPDYSATKIGGVLGLNPGAGTQLNATIGRKLGGGTASDATYFAFELVLYPK